MSTNADRLAQAVRARRAQLDLSQLDVWQAGGPSNTTLTEIENGRIEALTRTTAKRLDIGLKWEAGSARQVWEGGEPVPLRAADDLDELRQRVLASPSLTAERKAGIVAAIDAQRTNSLERGFA